MVLHKNAFQFPGAPAPTGSGGIPAAGLGALALGLVTDLVENYQRRKIRGSHCLLFNVYTACHIASLFNAKNTHISASRLRTYRNR